VIAGIAPMLGFIGTISGVIKFFYNISKADNISISLISGGLYEKLITSGVGLFIGIIAYIFYHFLNNKIDKMTQRWEYRSVRFIDLLNS
jgi:biopolymer transport protein ExbB